MLRLAYVGHATVLLDLDGVRLLTDPLLRNRVAHLRRSTRIDPDVRRGIDAVLVSHLHFDHLDIPSLRRLGTGTPIVVPRGSSRLLRRQGFTDLTELGSGDEITVGALRVRATPAFHDARRMPLGIRAEPLGYVVSGSRKVYFAGDTDVFEAMADIGPIDVALLPVAGWGPALGPGHMDAAEAARALLLLRPRLAIPIHWGTYFPVHLALRGRPSFVDLPGPAFAHLAADVAPGVEVRVLRPGEGTTV
jgi:L-ascorbate metabolism protein UlaG (beta-lactamase superfamily)